MDLDAWAGVFAGASALLLSAWVFFRGIDRAARALSVLAFFEGLVLLDEGLFFWQGLGVGRLGFMGYVLMVAATVVLASHLPGPITRWSGNATMRRRIWAVALLAGAVAVMEGSAFFEGAVLLVMALWPIHGAAVAISTWATAGSDVRQRAWAAALALRAVVWGSIVFIPGIMGWRVTTVTGQGTFIVGYVTEFYWVLLAIEIPVLSLMAWGLRRPAIPGARRSDAAA